MAAVPAIKYDYPVARPVLKWASGKGQLLPQIDRHLPAKLKFGAIKRYIEPFVGGGAVFFDLASNYNFDEVFLFDINPELVILYNVIKNDVEKLIFELRKIQTEYFADDRTQYYYDRRTEYSTLDKNIDANC